MRHISQTLLLITSLAFVALLSCTQATSSSPRALSVIATGGVYGELEPCG